MNFSNLADRDPRSLTAQEAFSLEHLARLRLGAWWKRIDRSPDYPADDETAVALVRGVEFAITREELVRFIEVGAFDGVAIADGRRLARAAREVQQLEQRRRAKCRTPPETEPTPLTPSKKNTRANEDGGAAP